MWRRSEDVMEDRKRIVGDVEDYASINGDVIEASEAVVYTVYRRRWLVLFLYAFYCCMSAIQWIQYAIIADVIVKYYGVSSSAVNWTSMIYMVAYCITIVPATWLFNKKGIRLSILLATGGTMIGCWIKVFSVAPDRFWVTFLGQTIVAFSQTYTMSIPAPLAAIWFGPSQVSTACAIGVFGLQLGNTLGFLIPTSLVPNDSNIEEIERGLSYMFYGVAIATTILFVLQLFFLQSTPPTVPSAAQANREGVAQGESVRQFLGGMWGLMKNVHFVLIFLSFGINVAVFSGVTTFLNQMILVHHPAAHDDAGWIGVTMVISGLVGTVVIGYVLDLTKQYKEMNVVTYALSALAMIAYTLILPLGNITYLYVISAVWGFFMIGYVPAAFEFAAEVTYPEAEATSTGVMALGCQVLSFLYTLGYGWVFNPLGDFAANLVMSGSLVLGTVFTVLVKSDLRRQHAAQA